jgi:hypothetical protein
VPSLTVLSENGDFEVETDDLISERAMLTVIYAISHVEIIQKSLHLWKLYVGTLFGYISI